MADWSDCFVATASNAVAQNSVNRLDAESEDYRQVPPGYWWVDNFPRLKAQGLPMLEVLQRPGETLFVPPQWWHAVINLPDTPREALTLCVTQSAPQGPLPAHAHLIYFPFHSILETVGVAAK